MAEITESKNFIHAFIDEDIAEGGRYAGQTVHTRFPPEPNGYLHIGHCKALIIDFGTAEKFGGMCNLRMDDTNPTKEDVEFVEAIQEDIRWLGFDWADRFYYGSDYFDQFHGVLVVLLKVVGAVEEIVAPVEAQPVDIFLDGVHELHIFLGGVGVVHTQVAKATKLLGGAEVDGQRLAVANVQIAVGLGGKTGVYGLAGITAAFCNILFNKGMNEIFAFGDLSHIDYPLFLVIVFHDYNPFFVCLQLKNIVESKNFSAETQFGVKNMKTFWKFVNLVLSIRLSYYKIGEDMQRRLERYE